MNDHSIDLKVCASLLRGITDDLMTSFRRPSPDADLQTLIDDVRAISEKAASDLKVALSAHYPKIGWGKEEVGVEDESSNEAHWIYDPIDGAYHFLQGLPLWSSTLVLIDNGKPVSSLVYEPYSRDLYTASSGTGAFLNATRISVSSKRSLETAVLGTAVPPKAATSRSEHALSIAQLTAITSNVFVVRAMASASLQLAYVAAGKMDGYWEVGHDINDWLAGALLVQEAGGTVTSFTTDRIGVDVEGVVAAPSALHEAIREAIATAS